MPSRAKQNTTRPLIVRRLPVITLIFMLIALIAIAGVSLKSTFSPALVTAQQPPLPQVVVNVDSYIATGMPVTITRATANSEVSDNEAGAKNPKLQGLAQLKFRLTANGRDKLSSVNIDLFEFDQTGGLRRIEGWVRDLDLANRASEEVTLELNRRLTPNARLVLAVERVNSSSDTTELRFPEMVRAIGQRLAGRPETVPGLQRSEEPLPDMHGAPLCASAFQRAMSLAQEGDKSGLTSFTCDRQERSFAFSFNSKKLLR